MSPLSFGQSNVTSHQRHEAKSLYFYAQNTCHRFLQLANNTKSQQQSIICNQFKMARKYFGTFMPNCQLLFFPVGKVLQQASRKIHVCELCVTVMAIYFCHLMLGNSFFDIQLWYEWMELATHVLFSRSFNASFTCFAKLLTCASHAAHNSCPIPFWIVFLLYWTTDKSTMQLLDCYSCESLKHL